MQYLVRSLAKNLTYGLAAIALIVAINATTVRDRTGYSGFLECWNPHTAQILTIEGNRCPHFQRMK